MFENKQPPFVIENQIFDHLKINIYWVIFVKINVILI